MAIAAQLYRNGRERERYRVGRSATLRDPAFVPIDVVVEDLSTDGFRVITGTNLPLGAEIGLGLTGIGTHRARVIWQDEISYGCQFVTPLRNDNLRMALSMPSSGPIALAFVPGEAAPSADSVQQRDDLPGFTPRGRLFAIVAAAFAAWVLVIGLGWIAYRIVPSLG